MKLQRVGCQTRGTNTSTQGLTSKHIRPLLPRIALFPPTSCYRIVYIVHSQPLTLVAASSENVQKYSGASFRRRTGASASREVLHGQHPRLKHRRCRIELPVSRHQYLHGRTGGLQLTRARSLLVLPRGTTPRAQPLRDTYISSTQKE